MSAESLSSGVVMDPRFAGACGCLDGVAQEMEAWSPTIIDERDLLRSEMEDMQEWLMILAA